MYCKLVNVDYTCLEPDTSSLFSMVCEATTHIPYCQVNMPKLYKRSIGLHDDDPSRYKLEYVTFRPVYII